MDLLVEPERVRRGSGAQSVVGAGEQVVGVVQGAGDDLAVLSEQRRQSGGQRSRARGDAGAGGAVGAGAGTLIVPARGQPSCSVCQSASSAAARISSASRLAHVDRRSMNARAAGSALPGSTICTRTSSCSLPSARIPWRARRMLRSPRSRSLSHRLCVEQLVVLVQARCGPLMLGEPVGQLDRHGRRSCLSVDQQRDRATVDRARRERATDRQLDDIAGSWSRQSISTSTICRAASEAPTRSFKERPQLVEAVWPAALLALLASASECSSAPGFLLSSSR